MGINADSLCYEFNKNIGFYYSQSCKWQEHLDQGGEHKGNDQHGQGGVHGKDTRGSTGDDLPHGLAPLVQGFPCILLHALLPVDCGCTRMVVQIVLATGLVEEPVARHVGSGTPVLRELLGDGLSGWFGDFLGLGSGKMFQGSRINVLQLLGLDGLESRGGKDVKTVALDLS